MSEATESQWPEGDAFDWTVEHALTYALHLVREKKVFSNGEPTKCYIVMLNDEDNNYGTREINSGLKRSEVVALLEIMKYRLMFDLHKPIEDESEPPKDTTSESDE